MHPSPQLLIFLDGVGIGPSDPDRNPFLQADLPTLRDLLDGHLPTLNDPAPRGARAQVFPLDATLGTPGTPQSGTGQVSLLTGWNAARIFGRHFGPWTPVQLRPVLKDGSVLARARRAGLPAAFANAYPRGYLESPRGRRPAAPPLAAAAAGLLVRHHEALGVGEAVASEIENTGWRRHLGFAELPDVSPQEAGRNLGRIASDHAFSLYAHYATDIAGHRLGMKGSMRSLERVDAFLEGVLETFPPDGGLVIASDHGNVEDVTGGHTRNPALGVFVGSAAEVARTLRPTSITDVPAVLGLPPESPAPPESGER